MRRKQQSKKTSSVDFRMRLRFRVSTSFFSQEFKEEVVINGRQVILKSAVAEQPLNQARWLIAGVNGFANENDAREYGVRLKRAIQFASVKNRIGVDCGKDIPTSRWGSEVKDSLLEQSGKNLRDDVHGIDVFKNDGNSFYMGITAHGQALAGVEPFLQNLIHFYPWMDKVSPKIEQIVIMLNNVIMNPEPVARIVLAISTIEGLGQDQKLSEGQKKLLVHLANTASEATNISHEESSEVQSIILSIHKLSLRQGVLRLLKSIGLDLGKEWDLIYAERSSLVHGIAPQPGVDYTTSTAASSSPVKYRR